MPRRCLVLLPLLLACAVPDARAGTASISTVTQYAQRGGGEFPAGALRYSAAPGEANDVRVTVVDRRVLVRDPAGVTAGDGCTATADGASCTLPSGTLAASVVELGDGDDRADGSLTSVDGGAGDDRLIGRFETVVRGGPGADVLIGGDMDGGAGPDRFLGVGSVSYAERTAGVRVTVAAGEGDDGEPGEGDSVESARLTVVGGSGDDVLVGADDPTIDTRTSIMGGPGADRLVATPRGSVLYGGPGPDRLEGGPASDRLDAAGSPFSASPGATMEPAVAGTDVLLGGGGDDELVGSPGADVIDGGPGHDLFSGGGGADVLTARDGAPDRLDCGPFLERGRVTGRSVLDAGDLVRGCAEVDRLGNASGRLLQFGYDYEGLPEGPIGLLAEIGCPQDVRGGCRLVLQASRGGRRAGAPVVVRVAPGTTRFVNPPTDRATRRAVLARGSLGRGRCRALLVTLTATTRDGEGRPRRTARVFERRPRGRACLETPDATRFSSAW